MFGDINLVLANIKPDDIVLDVGGWACPFNRANWVLDAEPYATRGFYGQIGLPSSQGGDTEFFSQETWVQRDMCEKTPFPFPDKFFDFSICSHTLEDIRDPLFVCSELIRVSKRGYIEVPSRVSETCRGSEADNLVGLSHHRWFVEIQDNHIQFTMKYHTIHSNFQLSFPPSYAKKLSTDESIDYIFWNNDFTFAETQIHGVDNISEELRKFVASRYQYPQYLLSAQTIGDTAKRLLNGIKRRIGA